MRIALNFQRVDPDRGGAETYVADLAHRLVAVGHDVSLYANQWRPEAIPSVVSCHHVPARGWTKQARIWSFAHNSESALRAAEFDCSVGLINTWHHDVIIPQGGLHQGSLDANARRFRPGWKRSLYRLGKRLNPSAGLYRAIEKKQYDPARRARVVAVSEMVRDHLEHYHQVPRHRISIVPNAIDAGRLEAADPRATRRAFRERLGLHDDDLVVLFVGHNYKLKGLGRLMDALALRARNDAGARPIHLVACGGGDPTPFRRKARDLGHGSTAHLVGFLPSVKEAYWAADAFALPTYYDPCSLVVLEALTCGLPVITTAMNGAGELITPGREGFVVPSPDSIEAISEALERLVDDGQRAIMARHARALGQAQSLDLHVERLLRVFEEVAADKRPLLRKRARTRMDVPR